MGAPVSSLPIAAIASQNPSIIGIVKPLIGSDYSSVLTNSNSQISVMARQGEVGKRLEDSKQKLETLWKAGSAVAGAVGAFNQLQSSFGDLVGQGKSLGERIQAVGKLLQSVMKIIQFLKAANAAVAALMSNPFSMAAARALATSTTIQTAGWLATLAQGIMTVGTAISAIQQATQRTESTTAAVGAALDPGMALPPTATPPMATPPYVPLPTTGQPFPTYGTTPTTPTPLPVQGRPVPFPGSGSEPINGIPNVYNSGWIPRSPGGTGGSGERITISLEDPDGDGKYNVKVDAEGGLDRDLKIGGKIGDQEFNLDIDSREA